MLHRAVREGPPASSHPRERSPFHVGEASEPPRHGAGHPRDPAGPQAPRRPAHPAHRHGDCFVCSGATCHDTGCLQYYPDLMGPPCGGILIRGFSVDGMCCYTTAICN
jgi:hypothetical protein